MQKQITISISYGASGRDFLYGISEYVHSQHRDWNLFLLPEGQPLDDRAFAELEPETDGFILNAAGALTAHEAIMHSTKPLVIFGEADECRLNRTARITYIHNIAEGIGNLAAKTFLKMGNFRAFGFIHARDIGTWSKRRYQGFAEALAARGCVCDYFEWTNGDLVNYIKAKPLPLALLAASDVYAMNIVAACRKLKLDIPRQVSVIGVDNDRLFCEFSTPTISSIAPEYKKEGFNAARALDRMMSPRMIGAKPKIIPFVKFDIFLRESTTPLPPAAALVDSALNYIHAHVTEPITATRVAEHLHVSRRLLDLRFHQFQNETLSDAILNIRLDELRRHLMTSNLSFSQIARNFGFRNPAYVKRLYLKRYEHKE